MAIFPKFTLTEKGELLLNRAIGEQKILVFTLIKLGEGETSGEDISKLLDVKQSFKEVSILETNVLAVQKTLKIKGYFDNTGFNRDILWKEIGVFAKIKDEPESEIMYSYTNAGTQGELIPMEKKGKFSRTLNILNYIGYASSVTFEITETKDKYAFNSVNEMKSATYLKEGDKVELWGSDVLGDGPIGLYIISKTNQNGVQLANNLYANYYNYVNALTDEEVDSLLNFEILDEVFTLATEKDIRNLFVGTRLEGGTEYKLSALSPDEAKMVNMKLLSLFNDLILQKVGNDRNTLKTELTSLINSTKSALQSAINLKEDKTKVTELLSALETKLNGLIDLKADTTYVNSVKKTLEDSIALKASTTNVNAIKKTLEDAINLRATIESVNKIKSDLTNLINGKAANTITITGTGALSGGGNLTANRTISHKDTSGFKHIPSGGAANQFLKWSADGTAVWSAIAWEVITGKTNITVGNGLTGGGNIGSNINIGLEILSDSEVDTLLASYKK